MFCYSITMRESFIQIIEYVKAVLKKTCKPWIPMVLVGLQADMQEKRQVTKEEGATVASWFSCPFIEVDSHETSQALAALSLLDELVFTQQNINNNATNRSCSLM